MCSVVDAWWFVTYLRKAIVRWVVKAEAQHRVRRAEPPVPGASYKPLIQRMLIGGSGIPPDRAADESNIENTTPAAAAMPL